MPEDVNKLCCVGSGHRETGWWRLVFNHHIFVQQQAMALDLADRGTVFHRSLSLSDVEVLHRLLVEVQAARLDCGLVVGRTKARNSVL